MATCVQFSGGLVQPVAGDPSQCAAVVISGEDYATMQSMLFDFNSYKEIIKQQGIGDTSQQANSFDVVEAGSIFTFFFTMTLGLWLLSKNIGLVLQAIRRF